jgi:ribosome-dependent ATPase
VSTLTGGARIIGSIWPTTYYMHSSLGAYTKGLRPGLMLQDLLVLACSIPILWGISAIGLRKQER